MHKCELADCVAGLLGWFSKTVAPLIVEPFGQAQSHVEYGKAQKLGIKTAYLLHALGRTTSRTADRKLWHRDACVP